MDEILTYKQLLYLLWLHFGTREFDTLEVSRHLLSDFEKLDPTHLITTRFRAKLMSNGLRRLQSYELVTRTKKVPREVVTKSGKKCYRGFKYMWQITQKGLGYLEHAKITAYDVGAILNRRLVAYAKQTLSGSEELLALAESFPEILPPAVRDINRRRTRLPNRVTFQGQAKTLASEVSGLLQQDLEELSRRISSELEFRQRLKRADDERRAGENVLDSIKEESEKRAKESDEAR